MLVQGKELNLPISSLDLLPTFASLAGVDPAGKPLDGVNVLPWLRGDATGTPHEHLFWVNAEAHQIGMRAGDFKAIQLGENQAWQLFNLADDMGEKNDLSRQMPEKVKTMSKECAAWRNQMAPERWDTPREK
jgi:arylsulfatase A-like enzyme